MKINTADIGKLENTANINVSRLARLTEKIGGPEPEVTHHPEAITEEIYLPLKTVLVTSKETEDRLNNIQYVTRKIALVATLLENDIWNYKRLFNASTSDGEPEAVLSKSNKSGVSSGVFLRLLVRGVSALFLSYTAVKFAKDIKLPKMTTVGDDSGVADDEQQRQEGDSSRPVTQSPTENSKENGDARELDTTATTEDEQTEEKKNSENEDEIDSPILSASRLASLSSVVGALMPLVSGGLTMALLGKTAVGVLSSLVFTYASGASKYFENFLGDAAKWLEETNLIKTVSSVPGKIQEYVKGLLRFDTLKDGFKRVVNTGLLGTFSELLSYGVSVPRTVKRLFSSGGSRQHRRHADALLVSGRQTDRSRGDESSGESWQLSGGDSSSAAVNIKNGTLISEQDGGIYGRVKLYKIGNNNYITNSKLLNQVLSIENPAPGGGARMKRGGAGNRYVGLFQLGKYTKYSSVWTKYGDVENNPVANLKAMIGETNRVYINVLKNAGLPVSALSIYAVHQLGPGGGVALLTGKNVSQRDLTANGVRTPKEWVAKFGGLLNSAYQKYMAPYSSNGSDGAGSFTDGDGIRNNSAACFLSSRCSSSTTENNKSVTVACNNKNTVPVLDSPYFVVISNNGNNNNNNKKPVTKGLEKSAQNVNNIVITSTGNNNNITNDSRTTNGNYFSEFDEQASFNSFNNNTDTGNNFLGLHVFDILFESEHTGNMAAL